MRPGLALLSVVLFRASLYLGELIPPSLANGYGGLPVSHFMRAANEPPAHQFELVNCQQSYGDRYLYRPIAALTLVSKEYFQQTEGRKQLVAVLQTDEYYPAQRSLIPPALNQS